MHHFIHFAYLDPGAGSLIIQSLIGISAGVALFGRRALTSVKRRMKSLFAKSEDSADK